MVSVPQTAPDWARRLADDVTAEFDRVSARGFPVRLPSYPKADLPLAASYPGSMIFVSDATGGAVPAFSNGVAWLRADTSAVIS